VSALPLPALGRVLQDNNPPQPLPASQASSVMVYSFIFPPTPTPIHPAGFGYLIPRPSQDYESAPHGMLGVVFDSCSLSAQDEGDSGFTKLTVMLGGPYPAWTREVPVDQILHNLSRQLGVALPQPVHVSRHMQQDCIPVPGPGHLQRVEKLRNALRSDWEGKLDVIGAGVGGVSFGDCVRQGREAGASWS
jgi:oxygen-dependent protoporphyrinogen oxidase